MADDINAIGELPTPPMDEAEKALDDILASFATEEFTSTSYLYGEEDDEYQ